MQHFVICDKTNSDCRSVFLLFPMRKTKHLRFFHIFMREVSIRNSVSTPSVKYMEDMFKVLFLIVYQCKQYWVTVGDGGYYKNKMKKKFSKFQVKKSQTDKKIYFVNIFPSFTYVFSIHSNYKVCFFFFHKQARRITFIINKALSEVTRRSEEQMEQLKQEKGTLRLQKDSYFYQERTLLLLCDSSLTDSRQSQ